MPFYSCPLGKHIGGISIKILHYLIWCHDRKGLSDSAGLVVLTVYIAACVFVVHYVQPVMGTKDAKEDFW